MSTFLKPVQAWTSVVNGKGGLNGHPVTLLVFDNGADPARHHAAVREAVEKKRAIAFVMQVEGAVGSVSKDYYTEKRIPVIGNDGTGDWYESPMYFSTADVSSPFWYQIILSAGEQVHASGQTPLAMLYCAELAECQRGSGLMSEKAAAAGFKLAYVGRASVAQPDYSAECLAARNARAEVLMVILDSTSISRLARSCSRQGYRPTYATASGIAIHRFKDEAELDGLVVNSPVFPYFQTGTPATDEFQRAVRPLGPENIGIGTAVGWTGAKLFERVAAQMPEPPTSEFLLRNLYSLKNEDLGGLVKPLSFAEGGSPNRSSCWWNVTIKSKAWVSPDGYKLRCK